MNVKMKRRKMEGDKDRCGEALEIALTSIAWWCLVSAGSHTHKELSQSAYNEICLDQHKHTNSILSHTEYLPFLNLPLVFAITSLTVCSQVIHLFIIVITVDVNASQKW